MPRRLLIRVAIATLLVAGCGDAGRVGGSASKTRTLTMLSPSQPPPELFDFAGAVERLSHGSLRVRLVDAGFAARTDYEAATVHGVQRGRADLGAVGSRTWEGLGVRSFDALTAPLLIDSFALQQRVLRSDDAHRMLEALTRLRLVGLGIVPGPLRKPFGLERPLTTLTAFRGLRIGTQQSRVADATARALGARPVRVALDPRGDELNGLDFQVAGINGRRLDVPGSHLAGNVDLWPRPLVLFASKHAFDRLDGGQRRALRAAAEATIPGATRFEVGDEREAAADICRRGRATFDSASRGDLGALRRAVEPVYRDLERDSSTRAAITAIERMKRDLAQPPDALAPCRRTASPTTTSRTPLDGTWRMDTDPADSRPDVLDENWGHWVFVFDHGRFAITQENPRACTWGYGTFAVRGDQTTWQFTDGGGKAPNGAENKPGESFSYRFSAYRDTLTLSPVKGRISPVNFIAKPWRKISSSASPGRLSRHCPPPVA